MTDTRSADGAAPGLTLDEVGALVGGRVEGDGIRRVYGVLPISEAGAGQLGLLSHGSYLGLVEDSAAEGLLIREALVSDLPAGHPPLVVVSNPPLALSRLLEVLHPEEVDAADIHPTAVLGRNVKLGTDVCIGPYAVVEARAVVGDGVRLGAHVVVGRRSRVGDGSVLHPHVVLYPDTVLGQRVILHAGARIGVDGFGYVFHEGEHRKVRQVGGCTIGDDVEIGANSCIDRGSIGHTRIGAGTKIDNLVHIGHNVTIGRAAIVVAQVGIAGSTRIGDGVVFGGQAGVAGHLDIGDGAVVAAQAGIIGDVSPGETMMGFPARPQREFLRATAALFRHSDLHRRVRRLEAQLEAQLEADDARGGKR